MYRSVPVKARRKTTDRLNDRLTDRFGAGEATPASVEGEDRKC